MSTNLLKHDRVTHQVTFFKMFFVLFWISLRCQREPSESMRAPHLKWRQRTPGLLPFWVSRYSSPSKIQQSWQQSRGSEWWCQTHKRQDYASEEKGRLKGQRWLDSQDLCWRHFLYYLPLDHTFSNSCILLHQKVSGLIFQAPRGWGEVLVGLYKLEVNRDTDISWLFQALIHIFHCFPFNMRTVSLLTLGFLLVLADEMRCNEAYPSFYGVKLCGREFIRAVIFTCGGSRWRKSMEESGKTTLMTAHFVWSTCDIEKSLPFLCRCFSWRRNVLPLEHKRHR